MKNNFYINEMSKNKNGYAVLELLFYITFFSILSLVVINSIIIMTRSLKETVIQAELIQGGTIMEKISREIRQANGINSIDTSNLILNVNTNVTEQFLLSGSSIQFSENGILVGNLNSSNVIITALNFTQIDTLKGKAVKVHLTIKSNKDELARTFDFYNTVVLRGSY